jgi:hypothetical protein
VLLDALSGFNTSLGDDPRNAQAMNLALQRLNEVGAASATFNDDTLPASAKPSRLPRVRNHLELSAPV